MRSPPSQTADRGVRLHGVVVSIVCIGLVELYGRRGECFIHVALFGIGGESGVELGPAHTVVLSRSKLCVVRLLVVRDLDEACGVNGHLEGLGDDGSYVLAAEGDLVGLQDREFLVAGVGQTRRILVGDDDDYAGYALGGVRVYSCDAATGDIALQRVQVEGVLDVMLVRVAGRTRDLLRSFDAVQGCADGPAGCAGCRVISYERRESRVMTCAREESGTLLAQGLGAASSIRRPRRKSLVYRLAPERSLGIRGAQGCARPRLARGARRHRSVFVDIERSGDRDQERRLGGPRAPCGTQCTRIGGGRLPM